MAVPTAVEWIGVPAWRQLHWLRAGFSTRVGGISQVYGPRELNLGWTAEDALETVAANRRAFLDAVAEGARGMQLVTARQVHGATVVDVDRAASHEGLEGDGLVTRTPGRWVGVVTADCSPVLLVDQRLRAVASLHAGWRGTVAGVVREGVRTMVDGYGSRPEDIGAAIGPCIGPCCFQVGAEVVAEFRRVFGARADRLVSNEAEGRASIDLQAANRVWLEEAGLPAKNIVCVEACTACARTGDGRRRFFSHRVEKGVTGRMLSVIGIVPGPRTQG